MHQEAADENTRLKRLLADAMLDNAALKDLVGKANHPDSFGGLCYYDEMKRDSEIDRMVAERNRLRSAAGLPALPPDEKARLRAARAERIFEAAFAVEQLRFQHLWSNNRDGFFANWGRYSKARQQVAAELKMGQHLTYALRDLGYRLAEDSWAIECRKTFVHDEDADRAFLTDLEMAIAAYGWKKHESRLRSFFNESTGEVIEIEPGGAETSGHFAHLMKGD